VNTLLRGILDLLYPPRCEACGRLRRDPLCQECRAQVELVERPLCEICGESFDPRAQAAPRCQRCRSSRKPFSIARSAAHYHGPLADAIRRFKYHGQIVLGKPLGSIMLEALAGAASDLDPTTLDVVCPVPLHASRQRERGFNQSLEIAKPVSRWLGIPLVADACRRTRNTPTQAGLKLKERLRNVRGAFACDLDLCGKKVAVLDDVMTTGATLNEISRILKGCGASEVSAWVVARTLPE